MRTLTENLRLSIIVAFAFLLLAAVPGRADVFKPAYLQLKQLDAETFEVTWKVPALDEQTTLKVKPQFPEGTEEIAERKSTFLGGAAVQRWTVRVPGGLEGKAITFSNLFRTGSDVLVRIERLDGSEQIGRILPTDPTFTLRPSPGPGEVMTTYTVIGIEHILLGFDHLLFVLGLIIITGGGWNIIKTVTAFTISHSITLTAATLGFVNVPQAPVEAIIALSIVFVATEILHGLQGRKGITARAPWLVALTFGLLHGLGFAGALSEVGLPPGNIPLALLFFSIGVEIGHFMFVAVVLGIWALAARLLKERIQPRLATAIPAYLIGGIASFWLVERFLAYWE